MESKPLSPVRRKEIEQTAHFTSLTPGHEPQADALRDLLAAEQFWREAVKDANHTYGRGIHDTPVCNFCNSEVFDGSCDEDCAYMVAQDSKTTSP